MGTLLKMAPDSSWQKWFLKYFVQMLMKYLCQGARYYSISKSIRCLYHRHHNTDSKTMVRILNVAEKNDAAKSLADIMSGGDTEG